MDILNRLKMDISAVSEELKVIRNDLKELPSDDYANKKELRSSHSQYIKDRKSLLVDYNKIRRESELIDEEIRIRIEKMKAEIDALDSFGQEVLEKDRIIAFLESQKPGERGERGE